MENVNFSEHLVKLQPDLFCFALKLTENQEEANDLLQATSLKVLDNELSFTPDTNFKGWVCTIMRNLFINNYRKVIRDQVFFDKIENFSNINFLLDLSEEPFEASYDLMEMHKVLNSLPKEFKIPFFMYVSGFKYREISQKLNIPLGTVKSRIFVTRQKLQCILKDFRY